MISNCTLCPRKCGIDRTKAPGYCKVYGSLIRVGRASLHQWEEPCISGKRGSGTIFFAGCNLGCVYCQNKTLSRNCDGIDISTEQLSNVMLRLQRDGAHNINLVTPTHYAEQIMDAVKIAVNHGLQLPIVYNTSGYETIETLQRLEKTVMVYLTDFKYADCELSQKYSRVSDYPTVAFRALEEMVRQTGRPVFDDEGLLLKGVIVRHLVLPGQLQNSKDVLKLVYNSFGDDVILSIMNQYTPIERLPFEELNRCVSTEEYDRLIDYALSIGIRNAFVQEEGTQQESFIPCFNGEGVLDDTNFNC